MIIIKKIRHKYYVGCFIVLACVWTIYISIVQINNLKRLVIAFINLKE